MLVEVAQLDVRVRGDLMRLTVTPEIRDVDREVIIHAHRRNGAHPRLVAIDRGELRELRALDHTTRQRGQFLRRDRGWGGAGHREVETK